jgi:hypothetical protein
MAAFPSPLKKPRGDFMSEDDEPEAGVRLLD